MTRPADRTELEIEMDAATRGTGCAAVGTQGSLLHPECRNEEERRYTSMFYRSDDVTLQG